MRETDWQHMEDAFSLVERLNDWSGLKLYCTVSHSLRPYLGLIADLNTKPYLIFSEEFARLPSAEQCGGIAHEYAHWLRNQLWEGLTPEMLGGLYTSPEARGDRELRYEISAIITHLSEVEQHWYDSEYVEALRRTFDAHASKLFNKWGNRKWRRRKFMNREDFDKYFSFKACGGHDDEFDRIREEMAGVIGLEVPRYGIDDERLLYPEVF